jgi:hypothetical protein
VVDSVDTIDSLQLSFYNLSLDGLECVFCKNDHN